MSFNTSTIPFWCFQPFVLDNKMCDDGVIALSETLRTNNTITELDLGSKLNYAIINSIIHTLFFFQ